ncbi:MAG TPA: cell cycle transcriptional regulator TrcR [Caulobacteraceae bacterium]|jgi:hypothetical protein
MTDILMPKATAVWLVDNTSLTFEQIADFCGLHPLEVKGIADGEVARDIRGADPIANGQLSREELDKAQADHKYRMKAEVSRHAELLKPARKAPRYTPVSRRQDRPDAIAWFIRHHPEVTDAQISKLLGTTKATIQQVRERTHWNSSNIKPVDPVTLGLSTQLELDDLVKKAAEKRARDDAKKEKAAGGKAAAGATLKPAHETTAGADDEDEPLTDDADVDDSDADEGDAYEGDDSGDAAPAEDEAAEDETAEEEA